MIFLILILAIVSPAFTFPLTDQIQTNTKQQDSYHQDSPVISHGEKTEIQKPQITINQKQTVQPIRKKVETETSQQQASVNQEKPKILQPHQQITKVSDSNSNFQLFQVEPFFSDILFLNRLREPIFLPFFSSSQIQPLSFVSVKQVRSINENPATEITHPTTVTSTVKPIEQKNIKVDIPSIKTPEILPQPHLNIPLPSVDQIFKKPILNNKNKVQTTKPQNVNDPLTIHQNEKHEQKIKIDEKQNTAEQILLKPQVQINSVPKDINGVQPPVKVNNQPDVKEKKVQHQTQENQDENGVLIKQHDNVLLKPNDQILHLQKNQPKTITELEQQPNDSGQFNIKEEIQKNSHALFSSQSVTEHSSQYYPYPETSETHHVQEKEFF